MKGFGVLLVAGGLLYWYLRTQQDNAIFLQNSGCADTKTKKDRILCLAHNARDAIDRPGAIADREMTKNPEDRWILER
jgi:hypothetical protein